MLNKINKTILGVVVVGSLVLSARAQNDVYAVEFNTGDNGFRHHQSDERRLHPNCRSGLDALQRHRLRAGRDLYGLAKQWRVPGDVDSTTGDVTPVASLGGSGIESIAFNPNNGVLFGASESGLYTIDPTTGRHRILVILAVLTAATCGRTSVLTPMATST